MSEPTRGAPGSRAYYARAAGTELLWIFGLSLLHCVALFYFGVIMMLGLGVQVLINNHFIETARANGTLASPPLVIAVDAAAASLLLVAGLFARSGIGVLVLPALAFYALDTLVMGWLVWQHPRDLMLILALVFHGYMTYLLFDRWNLMRQVPRPEPPGPLDAPLCH